VSLGKFPVAKALEDSERGIGIQGGEGRGGERFILTNVAAFHLNLNEQRCIVL